MRAAIEALQQRLVQAEQELTHNRMAHAAGAAAGPETKNNHESLVDTRTIGKPQNFSGQHKDWPEWNFQFSAYMGAANPDAVDAMKWAATQEAEIAEKDVEDQGFKKHNRQLYLSLALLCRGSALVTIKNTAANNGLDAWRKLNDL